MIRKIVFIDEEKCTGCGACASACHEGAIEMVNGKARLMRDDYCDGLGDCLPACPADAISIREREAVPYDEEAVKKHQESKKASLPCGCAGTHVKTVHHDVHSSCCHGEKAESLLSQWPVQIKLVPVNAPYFDGADILVAADCTAYAYGNFHANFINGRITLIGCPKLDNADYEEKLTEIFSSNDIKSVTVVRMEVPCCAGIAFAAGEAVKKSGKAIPFRVVTVSTDGDILSE